MRRILLLVLAAACGGSHSHSHSHAGPMHHRFEKADDWAPVFDDPGRDAWQRPAEVVELTEIDPGMTVADLGAGTGYFVPHLSRAVGAGGRVLALDVEADMVRYLGERIARERLENAVARQVPFDDPQLPDGEVQRVLVVDTWHHLSDRPAYVRKLARGLAPGGRVVVVDFTLESKLGPPVQHRLRPEQVADDLRAGGLEPRILDESLPEQYVVVGIRDSRPTAP